MSSLTISPCPSADNVHHAISSTLNLPGCQGRHLRSAILQPAICHRLWHNNFQQQQACVQHQVFFTTCVPCNLQPGAVFVVRLLLLGPQLLHSGSPSAACRESRMGRASSAAGPPYNAGTAPDEHAVICPRPLPSAADQ